jgi:hypothetical protein
MSASPTPALLADLGVDNDQVITRASSTVTDLFAGMTLSLFHAQEGTRSISGGQDLSKPQADIKGCRRLQHSASIHQSAEFARPTTGERARTRGPCSRRRRSPAYSLSSLSSE